LLQAFEESGDWVLLIGVEYLAPPKFGLATSLALLSSLGDDLNLQISIFEESLRKNDTSESICNFFYKKLISCCVTLHTLNP